MTTVTKSGEIKVANYNVISSVIYQRRYMKNNKSVTFCEGRTKKWRNLALVI